jgi:hypothetical protein
MSQRWRAVGVVAGVLLLINSIGRFVAWRMAPHSDTKQFTIALIALGGVVLAMIIAGSSWAIRHPVGRLLGDLGAALAAGAVLTFLIGPFFGGTAFWSVKLGTEWALAWRYLLVGSLAALFGLAIATMVGKDYRSVRLRQFVATRNAKPKRAVRS